MSVADEVNKILAGSLAEAKEQARPRALRKVRDDIERTARVVQALTADMALYTDHHDPPTAVSRERNEQVERLLALLREERVLMKGAKP